MNAQAPFTAPMVTPERRAEAHAWINEHVAKLKADYQRRQAAAQNELESTGVIKNERDYQNNVGYTVCPGSPQKPI